MLTPTSGIVLVDITEVSIVAFLGAHVVLSLLTGGAVARSPFGKKLTHTEATSAVTHVCEQIRKSLSPATTA